MQLDDCLITFIESRRQCNHNVPLLQEKLLVSVNLGLALLYLVSLPFDLVQLALVLLSDSFLLLLESCSELGCVFNLFATVEHLRVHRFDLIF